MEAMDLETSTSASIRNFVTARVDEVVALSKEIQHQSGFESKGLAFQHVPKHMRRRAVSHNYKRLPKRLQVEHLSQFKKSGGQSTKPKRPWNKYRHRQKKDLTTEYNRRQLKQGVKWLETHLWHAKRFHMEKKWGYKIPVRPTDKSYRAIYRAHAEYSVMQDISYYSCLQLSGKYSVIYDKMARLVPPKANQLGIHAKHYIHHFNEGTAHFYKQGKYPFGYIGPVSFFWNSNATVLWMWVHPSFKSEIVTELEGLFNLKKIEIAKPGASSSSKSNIDMKKLETKNLTNPITWRGADKVELVDLEGALNRFRLSGPETTRILQDLLRIKSQPEENSENTGADIQNLHHGVYGFDSNMWEDQAEIWNENLAYNAFPRNCVIPLVVRDPRVFQPKQRTKPSSKARADNTSEDVNLLLPPFYRKYESPLWSQTQREEILRAKCSDKEVEIGRRKCLLPGSQVDLGQENDIPVILINKPEQYGGWDLIVPATWGMPFLLGLSFRSVRVMGHRDELRLTFGQIAASSHTKILQTSLSANIFPIDSTYGQLEASTLNEKARKIYFGLPPDKRNHFQKLKCPFPFEIDWLELLQFWQAFQQNSSSVNQAPVNEFYVLRDSNQLQILGIRLYRSLRDESNWESRKELPNLTENCLIPITVSSYGGGTPCPNAILCIPTIKDLDGFYSRSITDQFIDGRCHEPELGHEAMKAVEDKKNKLKAKHRKHLAILQRKRKKEIEAFKLMQTGYNRKQSPNDSTELCEEYKRRMEALFIPKNPTTVLNEMSRTPLGFVTFGGECYHVGFGAGFGYITAKGYDRLTKLYRDYYHHLIQRDGPEEAKKFITQRSMSSVVLIRDAKSSLVYRFAALSTN